jgi:proteasome lid subunit RPN8/RPN11
MLKLNNVSKNPEIEFEFSESDLALLDEDSVIATFHTHPGRDANLSLADYMVFKNYPRLKHYICGKNGCKCYLTQGGVLIEKS